MSAIEVSSQGTEKEKVGIVVAGGSGIGAACVRELAACGWRVVALSLSGRARQLAESLGGAGVDGTNTNVEDLRATVDLAIEKFGRIDAVINNSGHAARSTLLELSDDDWLHGMKLYLLNVVRRHVSLRHIFCFRRRFDCQYFNSRSFRAQSIVSHFDDPARCTRFVHKTLCR